MSQPERLTPERAVRLLRAKGAELENYVLNASGIPSMRDNHGHEIELAADIALIAQLLADHIERIECQDEDWKPADTVDGGGKVKRQDG